MPDQVRHDGKGRRLLAAAGFLLKFVDALGGVGLIERLVESTGEPTSDNLRRAGLFEVIRDHNIRRRLVWTDKAGYSGSTLELCEEMTEG